jgi:hypothetical protein
LWKKAQQIFCSTYCQAFYNIAFIIASKRNGRRNTMKRKLLILSMVAAMVGVAIFHHDPLQLLANFIVGGVVPGLNISLGFIPTLGVILALLWLMKRWISDIHFQMIRRTALEMSAENAQKELTVSEAQDRSERRAVVAARGLETASTTNL